MSSEAHKYYAHGKFLLTGEYTVLHGAQAIALPLKLGQVMRVYNNQPEGQITWKGYYKNDVFIDAQFASSSLQLLSGQEDKKIRRLRSILQAVRRLKPGFAAKGGYKIDTGLEFPLSWGLGSSSTLLANIAQWARIDPFALNELVSQGSGYDIACATSQAPVFYALKNNKPDFRILDFKPPFKDQLYFIYQGQKQSSDDEVNSYLKRSRPPQELIKRISEITREVLDVKDIKTLNTLMQEHEALMGKHLQQQPLQQKHFPDFKGVIKSLGAWGGDFMMATWDGTRKELEDYFAHKGLHTVLSWDEIILLKP